MKRRYITTIFGFSILLLFGCSSNEDQALDQPKQNLTNYANDSGVEMEVNDSLAEESVENSTEDTVEELADQQVEDRMVIHQANLRVEVNEIEKAQLNVEKQVDQFAGYIVESTVFREGDEQVQCFMTVRIPENHFQQFLNDIEEASVDVLERHVSGQDVTEQYVDLESRLKSKQAVETRLLEFMEEAEKTEDLLKISSDLATVQEEIEVLVGKMNYLENQTAYSTIELTMTENQINVPEIDGNKLNTWEKTKKQLATSANYILIAASTLTVFIIGNLPIFIILGIIGFVVYIVVRKKKNNNKEG